MLQQKQRGSMLGLEHLATLQKKGHKLGDARKLQTAICTIFLFISDMGMGHVSFGSQLYILKKDRKNEKVKPENKKRPSGKYAYLASTKE